MSIDLTAAIEAAWEAFDADVTVRQVRASVLAAAPLIETAVREAVAAEIEAAVGSVVRHKGGSAGVYERSPNGTETELWSYGNAVAYTGAVTEVLALIRREVTP